MMAPPHARSSVRGSPLSVAGADSRIGRCAPRLSLARAPGGLPPVAAPWPAVAVAPQRYACRRRYRLRVSAARWGAAGWRGRRWRAGLPLRLCGAARPLLRRVGGGPPTPPAGERCACGRAPASRSSRGGFRALRRAPIGGRLAPARPAPSPSGGSGCCASSAAPLGRQRTRLPPGAPRRHTPQPGQAE